MKVFAFVLSVLALSSSAYASKARVLSQQGAFDLHDIQTTFQNPAYIHKLNQLLTFEMGGTSATSTPKAEGGFLMKKNDATWGAYLGHQNALQNSLRSAGGTTYPKTDNPVNVFYGKNNWAVNVGYSQSSDLNASTAQQTGSVGFGMLMADDGALAINADLLATAENTDDKYTGAPVISVDYQRPLGEWVVELGALTGDTKQEASKVESKVKVTGATVGFMHRPMQEIYYGIAWNYLEKDIEGAKETLSVVPVFLGIEKDVLSWATFRGSIKQNFLGGQTKTATTQPQRNLNDTTVSLGLGLKMNGFQLDGTVAGSANGKVDGNNVLANGSVTYNF